MLIAHKDHNNIIGLYVYSVNVMTHAIASEAGHSNQGTFEPITPAFVWFGPGVPFMYTELLARTIFFTRTPIVFLSLVYVPN